jgi:lipopolysaccharide transport system ATP-binding protein
MTDTVIDIHRLGKRYALSHKHRPDSLKALLRELVNIRGKESSDQFGDEEFWALSDVSLQVRQGEFLALVGKNGSGKSTLLKILSRIVPPTCGHIRVRGQVASLLEVGTGFHPELTGRENIFLNAAMLGCPEREIAKRFDAIVDFSGVERFLDTPVKHYSSGMYVRLAFAVAAHVDSDIQIIDEVLAVGDSEFMKKCVDNLLLQRSNGKTIIFVTHNEHLITTLATRKVELSQGKLIA